ncbi:hypothetical protein C2S51_019201 [Perilla frutescens var. frutescens]|nr:hypothetical protein C2S51_019201 [Perilla frutescens var. frutescens]
MHHPQAGQNKKIYGLCLLGVTSVMIQFLARINIMTHFGQKLKVCMRKCEVKIPILVALDQQNNQRSEDQEEENDLIYSTERIASLSSYMKTRSQLRNREAHAILRDDLIEHIWQKFGHQY